MITRSEAYMYNERNIKHWTDRLLACQRLRHKAINPIRIQELRSKEIKLIDSIKRYSSEKYPE
jgi:hypothetical protein